MGEMADLDADSMGDLPDDESTTLEEDVMMEPLRERVRLVIIQVLRDNRHVDPATNAILQAVEEDRAMLDSALAESEAAGQKAEQEREHFWEMREGMRERAEKAEAREAALETDLAALQTERNVWESHARSLGVMVAREAALVEMLRQAHDACYSEYMGCPWCSGHLGWGAGGEWHDDTCKYAALAVKDTP